MDRDTRRAVALLIGLAVVGVSLISRDWLPRPEPVPATPDGYLFCSWNVENFYDDQDDPRNHDEDEDWFAQNPDLVGQKVRLLTGALLRQNDGRGPDVLAAVEVESLHCLELLRDALNAALPAELRYPYLAFEPNLSGRRFAPGVLSRLPIREGTTRAFGSRRILEVQVEADGAPLFLLASHWTSRVRGETESKREAYADALYARALELTSDDPARDVLLSGDYNDESDDPSLTDHLHATGDAARVREELSGAFPLALLDLTAGLDRQLGGTYLYKGRWQYLDHILAAPGLLDSAGWSILPDTLRTENAPELRFGRDGRPWAFGGPKNPNPRGPSDHFALTVRLKASGGP